MKYREALTFGGSNFNEYEEEAFLENFVSGDCGHTEIERKREKKRAHLKQQWVKQAFKSVAKMWICKACKIYFINNHIEKKRWLNYRRKTDKSFNILYHDNRLCFKRTCYLPQDGISCKRCSVTRNFLL